MKMYGGNTVLAGQLLETAFALLRNAGREPVEILDMVYGALAGGIDVSPSQQKALYEYLRRVIAEYDRATGDIITGADGSSGEPLDPAY